MKLADIRISVDRFENGGWVEDIPDMGNLRLKVRGFGSKAFREFEEWLAKRQRNASAEQREEDYVKAIAEAILLDWENVYDDDGRIIPYTVEDARRLLGDPELRFFRLAVEFAAREVARPPALKTA